MPESNFIEWIVQQTGLAGVAILALYMLNAVWKKHCEDMRVVWEQTRSALNHNTEILTRLLERLDLDDDRRERQKEDSKRR